VEATPTGYLVSWTAGPARIEDPAQAADPLMKRMSGLFAGYRILFEVDGRDASIKGVRNWEEIQGKLKAFTDGLMAELRTTGEIPANALAAIEQQMSAMSSTREQVEKAATGQAGSFLAATGRAYRIGKPFEYDVELPGPIGGASIPCRGRFTLRSHEANTGRAVIDWSQTMDPERAKAAIERMLRDMAAKSGRPFESVEELRTMTVEDKGTFVLDSRTGWPLDVHYSRTMAMAGGSQTDELRFTRRDRDDQPVEDSL
jgi:hypothetical protein